MVRITEQLVRKRAEHNEGLISSLEEVSLHQQEIEKIENLDKWCRELKILYLQNNLIAKIENVGRLKMLEYLNMALNAVERVEGLHRCESLNKLDLTVNFIDLPHGLLSVASLSANEQLRDLYLTGNPCTSFEGYREFVIASVPSLRRLDGQDVLPSERIAAQQRLGALRAELEAMAEAGVEGSMVRKPGEFAYTKEQRLEEHREEVAQREKEAEKARKAKKSTPWDKEHVKRREGFDPLPDDESKVYQKNEGEWDFTLRETDDGQALALEVDCGKYLDTSLVDIDVQPRLVRLLIKGKLLQLKLEAEVSSDRATAQRSKTTGSLLVTMPLSDPSRAVLAMQGKKKASATSAAARETEQARRALATATVVEGGGQGSDDDDEPPPLEGARLPKLG